jgi:hypothetical protein
MILSLKFAMTPHSSMSYMFHRYTNLALIVGGGRGGRWDGEICEKNKAVLSDCVPKEVLPKELFADMAVRSFCTSDIIQAAV